MIIKLRQEELRRRAERWRRHAHPPVASPAGPATAAITLRLARPDDAKAGGAVANALAVGDAVLVADVDGEIVGARSLDGTRVARPADALVGDLLDLRARQLRRLRRRSLRPQEPVTRDC